MISSVVEFKCIITLPCEFEVNVWTGCSFPLLKDDDLHTKMTKI
jgi:hypothetical protein